MGIRLAPSAIDRYLRDPNILWLLEREDGRAVRIPSGAGSAISPKLNPLLERILDEVGLLALQFLVEENRHRKPQSQYQLKNPRTEDYDKAARLYTKAVLRYIFEDSFDKMGGDQRGETPQPNERSESTDPHGGDLE